jgi:hypothetical protein
MEAMSKHDVDQDGMLDKDEFNQFIVKLLSEGQQNFFKVSIRIKFVVRTYHGGNAAVSEYQ